MKNTNQKAFTIMEIMTVVIIVGILAVFAIPNLMRTMQEAREQDAVTQLRTIHSANKIFRAQNGSYWPLTVAAGDTAAEINAALGLSLMENNITYACAPGITPGTNYSCTGTNNPYFVVTLTEVPLSATNPATTCGGSPC